MDEIFIVALLGLAATVSNIAGAALGLYFPLSGRVLSCLLAFAAGGLISALAIDLAFGAAQALHDLGFSANAIWLFVGGGFAAGAVFYYLASLALDARGAAIRSPYRFREYVLKKKRQDAQQLIKLLSNCELMRHLPPEAIERLLPFLKDKRIGPGEVVFKAGDPGDALYIVSSGKVEVVDPAMEGQTEGQILAELGEGQAFGEMALLAGGARTATVRAVQSTELLLIERTDFEALVAADKTLETTAVRLSHERAIRNLSKGGAHPGPGPRSPIAIWMNFRIRIRMRSLPRLRMAQG